MAISPLKQVVLVVIRPIDFGKEKLQQNKKYRRSCLVLPALPALAYRSIAIAVKAMGVMKGNYLHRPALPALDDTEKNEERPMLRNVIPKEERNEVKEIIKSCRCQVVYLYRVGELRNDINETYPLGCHI